METFRKPDKPSKIHYHFSVKGVVVQVVSVKKEIKEAGYVSPYVRLNQHEFTLDIEGVGWFYARSGNYVAVLPAENASSSTIDLYLNGSVCGAILHQRKTLPFHGSCFRHRGLGVMICGDSGVGKSSLTTAFCLRGADFLTDDVTPVLFKNNKPHIQAGSDRIKLWDDSLQQLNQTRNGLERIMPEREKFYFPMLSNTHTPVSLDLIIRLHVYDQPGTTIEPLTGVPCFTALRNEIFRGDYLPGMPDSETAYLSQLITISRVVRVINVYRPRTITIERLRAELVQLIDSLVPGRTAREGVTKTYTR